MMKTIFYYFFALLCLASIVDSGFIRGTTLLDPKSIELKEETTAAAAEMNNGKNEEKSSFRQLKKDHHGDNTQNTNQSTINLTQDVNDEQRKSPLRISSNQMIMNAAKMVEPIIINDPLNHNIVSDNSNDNSSPPLDIAPPVGQQKEQPAEEVQQQQEAPPPQEEAAQQQKVQVMANQPEIPMPSQERIDAITKLGKKNPRKFVKYESSEWEQMWLRKIKFYEAQGMICEAMDTDHHMSYMHEFLNKMCTNRLAPPNDHWCFMFDHAIELWYNTANTTHYDLHWSKPPSIDKVELQNYEPYVNHHMDGGRVLSKFTFLNENSGEEYEEYIEPLVSHLRFPLSKCFTDANAPPTNNAEFFRGWIVPPPPTIKLQKNHKILYDIGATEWSQGNDASLHYFTSKWSIQSIHFDSFNVFGTSKTTDEFMSTVPDYLREYVHYKQCPAPIASSLEEHSSENPFIPIMIQQQTKDNDYVVMKLDDPLHPKNEAKIIHYILNENVHVDELFWEHHISGNYLMKDDWGTEDVDDVTLEQSYAKFLEMRQKGIRAHSWV